MSRRLRLAGALAAAALGSFGFRAPPPTLTPPPAPPKPPLSFVSATLKIPGADIVSMLNERTKSQLAHFDKQKANCLIQKCQLEITAVRTGEITGRAAGSGMQLALPFALRAHLNLNSKFLGSGGDAVADGEATAVTQLALTEDWRVDARTEGDVHLSNAKLRIGLLKMSVAELWNGTEGKLSGPIFRTIDKRISAALKLRGEIEHLWHKLHQPIRIGKNPESWLVLSPERFRVTPLKTVDDNLVLSVEAEVRARVVLGTMPKPPEAAPRLPAPESLASPSNTFAISLPVTLSYADAAKLAMQRLTKKPIRAGKVQVRIDKLRIMPSGADLIVAAQFCLPQLWDFTHLLDSCGEGYLRGTPRFDPQTSSISILHLHYDIGTQNLMLRIMRALAGEELGKALERDLVFNESREIDKLKSQIALALAKPQGRGIALTGHVDSFGAPRLSWTKDGFVALLTAKGTLNTELNMKSMN